MDFDGLNAFFDDVQKVYDTSDVYVNTESNASLHCEAAKVLALCVNTMGYVKLSWMSDNSGLSVKERAEALEGTIYQETEEDDWILCSQYVDGNISAKLEIAKRMNVKYGGCFTNSIQALQDAKPEKIPFEEIGISIGSAWVLPVYYALFTKELLGVKTAPEVLRLKKLGQWKVRANDTVKKSFNNQYTYGFIQISPKQS